MVALIFDNDLFVPKYKIYIIHQQWFQSLKYGEIGGYFV